MKMSPIYPRNKDEAGKYHECEFDPHADFAQFLGEARRNTREGGCKATTGHVEQPGKTRSNGEKRNKKSWKSSLFSWLKTDKKNEILGEPFHGATIPKLRRGTVSGPIHGGGSGLIASRSRQPTSSGALTSLFNPGKTEEDGTPYFCLSHLNNPPPNAQSYGPVYLVT